MFVSISALLLHGGLQVTFLLWTPDPDYIYLFYLFAALWGAGDAIIQTQINGRVLKLTYRQPANMAS